MDTRQKILTLDQARQLSGAAAMAIGAFDVLRASTIRELQNVRSQLPEGGILLVVVLADGVFLTQEARAELAAALRMVDYVVTAEGEAADRLGESLKCSPIVRLSEGDAQRSRELKEHVRGRQK
ncbi:MAG TPA: hypothetical protein VML19_02270 [Verrucomicrobiae bacterium]|nr:hypothetical protein [Verrucomicrobiae bacterium]